MKVTHHRADVDVVLRHRSLILSFESLAVLGRRAVGLLAPVLAPRLVHVL